MVVDDNEDGREVLARFLEGDGHSVCTAADGLEGLQAACKFHPEIIFLDLYMPRMDGFELCTRLRERRETENAAIFALTGSTPAGCHRSRLPSGFDAYLGKPVELDVIKGLLNAEVH